MKDYERLTIEEFGTALFETRDLDPVYVLLHEAQLPPDDLARWLLAYWCFYSVGVACWMTETGDAYWGAMKMAAENTQACVVEGRWPRGRERRHFRGIKSLEAIDGIHHRFGTPQALVRWLSESGRTFEQLAVRVQALPLFGPWIAFKVGDMLERVVGVPVNFDEAAVFMFEQPRQSAVMLHEYRFGKTNDTEAQCIEASVRYLLNCFEIREAPPRPGRRVGLQEIETVLCKWKSHVTGSYPLGTDIAELHHHVRPWCKVSQLATRMYTTIEALRQGMENDNDRSIFAREGSGQHSEGDGHGV